MTSQGSLDAIFMMMIKFGISNIVNNMNTTNLGTEQCFEEFKADKKITGQKNSPGLQMTHNQTMKIPFLVGTGSENGVH